MCSEEKALIDNIPWSETLVNKGAEGGDIQDNFKVGLCDL